MSDLIRRLRNIDPDLCPTSIRDEIITELERLEEENRELKRKLKDSHLVDISSFLGKHIYD